MIFLRSLLYQFWFYLSMGLIGLPVLPFALASRDVSMKAIKFWARTQSAALYVLCGIKTEFRGLHNLPPGASIIAMKHQSTYDTIAPFLFIEDPAYILKKELLKLPVFGTYASRVGIAIDRSGGVRTMKNMLKAAKEAGANGQQIVIFPEGTRQPVDAPTELKPGVVAMYNDLAIPCVPVALNTGLCWRGSGFLRRPGHVVFEVLPPIEPGLERRALTQRLKEALDPATARLVAEGRKAQGRHALPIPPPIEPKVQPEQGA
ncbi:MAG: lysophospholipid acyltransferase family protein [Hyphomonadaceae bacterium]|nr:lysophospholipid acyltransferase family protein [Hyphomonadaceae bacterium]